MTDELQHLREENAHLKSLLKEHGIAWEMPSKRDMSVKPPLPAAQQLSTQDKVVLFRRLFRGRTDVYPVRWESAKGASGYSPACKNEWRQDVCFKPKVKCGNCANRILLPLSDQVVYTDLNQFSADLEK